MNTPQQPYPELAKSVGIPALYLKREDLHHLGSHKGRSIPYMIDVYAKKGHQDFVISSSGNAALAAVRYICAHNTTNPDSPLSLRVFVGQHISPEKMTMLQSEACNAITIEQVDRPKQQAFQLGKSRKAIYLRQSADELALKGYENLANELNQIPNLRAVFVPTSSGTTAQALGQWFAANNPLVQVHIVQTQAVHPIAEAFASDTTEIDRSRACAIVDRVAHRKLSVVEAIKKTNGSGWIPTEEQIADAQSQLEEQDISATGNGALALAGLLNATEDNWRVDGAIACLICGK